jgi:hypothetical protein
MFEAAQQKYEFLVLEVPTTFFVKVALGISATLTESEVVHPL